MKKILIYQLLPRLFGNTNDFNKVGGTIFENGCGKFNDINDNALQAIKNLGITHIWLTGIIDHATTTDYSSFCKPANNRQIVKGNAGSPYAVRNYFDVAPDLAVNVDDRMSEFQNLVDRIHRFDMKVIIDFVPNHVARQYKHQINCNLHHSDVSDVNGIGVNENDRVDFDVDNNFYYLLNCDFVAPTQTDSDYKEFPAKVTGNDCLSPQPSINDWYETVKLNYGINIFDGSKHFEPTPYTWNCMKDVLNFWSKKNIDGFRCDMAEMIPVEFWKWVIEEVKTDYPELIFIAEIYKPELYGTFIEDAGFDFLYDKVDMYDSLCSVIEGHSNVSVITDSWQRTNSFNGKMLRFLENHDEQRIASKFFAVNPIAALPAFAVAAFMHGSPLLLYNGQEFGENANGCCGYSGDDGRTTIFDYWCYDIQKRWNNHGAFNDECLCQSEISLRNKYKDILQTASSDTLISDGEFYDLMWVNQHLVNDNCYAFIRHNFKKGELFVINFSNKTVDMNINITQNVCKFLKFCEKTVINCKIEAFAYNIILSLPPQLI